jgi:hypothetical protein
MRIVGSIIFLILLGIVTFLIHPIAFFVFVVIPIVGVLYNRKK